MMHIPSDVRMLSQWEYSIHWEYSDQRIQQAKIYGPTILNERIFRKRVSRELICPAAANGDNDRADPGSRDG
jgi:hypothetical protein